MVCPVLARGIDDQVAAGEDLRITAQRQFQRETRITGWQQQRTAPVHAQRQRVLIDPRAHVPGQHRQQFAVGIYGLQGEPKACGNRKPALQ